MGQENQTAQTDEQEYREVSHLDSIENPIDVINRKIIQSMRLPFCAISTGKYREGQGFYHYHEGFHSYCLFVTTEGEGEALYRGKTCRLRAGDMTFTSSAIPVRCASLNGEWRFEFVNLMGDYCALYEQLWNENGFTVIHTGSLSRYTDLIGRITMEINQPYMASELNISLFITRLLTDALNEKYMTGDADRHKLYPRWVVDAAKLISDHCTEELKISDIATQFFMEQNNFIRQFKKYIGETPKAYQITCRLERAAILLQNGNMSMLQVAEVCGFASPSFFSQTFKKAYGVTPTDYAKGLHNP